MCAAIIEVATYKESFIYMCNYGLCVVMKDPIRMQLNSDNLLLIITLFFLKIIKPYSTINFNISYYNFPGQHTNGKQKFRSYQSPKEPFDNIEKQVIHKTNNCVYLDV